MIALAEYRQSSALRQREIDWLMSKGVTIHAIAAWPMLTANNVIFDAHGRFEFGDGERVLTIFSDCGDIVAWHPGTHELASWLGTTYAINWTQVFAPNLDRDPLPVWRDPLGWLAAGRDGIVPVAMNRWRWSMLDHQSGLIAEDIAHGEELRRATWNPHRKIPVFVRQAERVAA